MAVVKTKKKEIIDQIQAKLTLQVGRRFTQQEVVDLCIEYAQENLEDLISLSSQIPKLTPKLAEQILNTIDHLPEVPYDPTLSYANEIDGDIYSL